MTSKKDWSSDQEVRWCPGCGDYGILQAVQQLMPELGVAPENTVFISGIGCSSRFPYYMNTYGMHSIHGRAPAIATGVAVARPDLDVWVITGDGDGLSIGGNHLIHALRRNVNLTILLFNNRIYGLTKGQYSPTSEVGKVTKSTPMGSIDPPFNPLAVALGAEASFVARTHDLDRKHMMEIFRAAHDHRGAAFVEIFQNCNVFNDGQFEDITRKPVRDEMMIELVHGEPILFGEQRQRGVMMGADGQLRLVEVADVGLDAILRHDAERADPSLAFALARLSNDDHSPTPFGIFRRVVRQEYASAIGNQLAAAAETEGPRRPRRPDPLQRHLDRLQLTDPLGVSDQPDVRTAASAIDPGSFGLGISREQVAERIPQVPRLVLVAMLGEPDGVVLAGDDRPDVGRRPRRTGRSSDRARRSTTGSRRRDPTTRPGTAGRRSRPRRVVAESDVGATGELDEVVRFGATGAPEIAHRVVAGAADPRVRRAGRQVVGVVRHVRRQDFR